MKRPLLSCFHASDRYVQSTCWTKTVLWNNVLQELSHFRALTVFCYSQWWSSWSTEVFSTDASLYGYWLAASDWSREEVAEAGRRNERSRYRLGAENAREHALAQIGFVVDHDIGKVREAGSEDKASIPLMAAERWEEDPGFEEIPPSLLVGSRWRTLSCGRWLCEDDIPHLQSRGINRAVSRAANCRPCCDCRVFNFERQSQCSSCLRSQSGTRVSFDHSNPSHVCLISGQKHQVLF